MHDTGVFRRWLVSGYYQTYIPDPMKETKQLSI